MKRRSIKRFYVALSVDFGHIIFFLSFYIFHSAKIFDKPSTRDYNLFPSITTANIRYFRIVCIQWIAEETISIRQGKWKKRYLDWIWSVVHKLVHNWIIKRKRTVTSEWKAEKWSKTSQQKTKRTHGVTKNCIALSSKLVEPQKKGFYSAKVQKMLNQSREKLAFKKMYLLLTWL